MTYIIDKPKSIEELDKFLSEQYKVQGRPDNWKEQRKWLIELYDLKEEYDAE
ncbi:MAG: hypothetical protein Unbinned97contig1000_50 [Prokaryotic dsDNA virus sp.]|nr:MAG: hypothetical protein Unbinned97contig1000_50 [Prokaryotic dsDNA virus sp.]|tara:strand:+ start:8723 stop:8878 length:156 start_codon:yes stop_codon:yes gene_type:complete